MTEAEWLACRNPWAMLDHLGTTTERKERLVLVACCRAQPHALANAESQLALAAAERYADGLLATSTLRRYRQKVGRVRQDGTGFDTEGLPEAERFATNLCILAATSHGAAGLQPTLRALHYGILGGDLSPELTRCLPMILREIIYPFHPFGFNSAQLTQAIASLAHAAYQERQLPSGHLDTDRLAVLSDALEEAGCTDVAILEHLRSPGPHVRGCWALDLILGKS